MKMTLAGLLLLLSACNGPYVMEKVEVENGMVVGDEQIEVNGDGQVVERTEEGYVPDDRYLDAYQDGGQDLGPNSPGYIPQAEAP